ncbi:MAG: T9SS type A sorting domain-containing protein [Bacteroidales bacterium]|jgi:hypothetical protein|nr:T9SS type A sorting domain-containing protein [Bacteroidales bacterium]
MKNLKLTTIFIFVSSIVFSQSAEINFSKQIGGSENDMFLNSSIAHDRLWSVGYSESDDISSQQKIGDTKAWIYGCNYDGDSILSKFINGSGTEIIFDVIEGGENNLMVVGQTSSTDGDFVGLTHYGGYDAFLAIVDTLGNIMYITKYGGSNNDNINKIIRTNTNGFLLIGDSESNDGSLPNNGTPDQDAWIYRLSPTLDSIWSIKIGWIHEQSFIDGAITNENEIILVGTTQFPKDDNPTFWAVKLNSLGELEMEIGVGGSAYDRVTGFNENSDGNYMMYGFSNSDDLYVEDHLGGIDGFVVKFTMTEENWEDNILWTKSLGWSDSDEVISDVFEYEGRYYALLSTQQNTAFNNYGETDIVLVEFDENNQTYINHFGGQGNEPFTEGSYVSTQKTDNQILISSSSNSSTDDLSTSHGGADGWIFSLDILTALESNQLKHEISLYPNPTKSTIQLEISKYEQFPIGYTIIDNQGKLVQKGLIYQASETIDIRDLPQGAYYIKTDNPYCNANSFIKE